MMAHVRGIAFRLASALLLGVTVASASGAAAAPSVSAADYATLDEAVGALPAEGGTVLLPPGRFVLTKTLNLSWARHRSPQFSVNLRGAGKLATVVLLDTDRQPGLDVTGNSYWTVSDLHLMNRSANVGVLLARTPPGANGCSGEFRNVNAIALRFREDAAGKPVTQDSFSCGDIPKAIRARWRLVSLGDGCHGNRITASEPGQVDVAPAAAKRNVVTVLNPER